MIDTRTTYVVTIQNRVLVIRNVPCEECAQCGEKYFSDEVMEHLDKIVQDVKKSLYGEVTIADYMRDVA